MVIKKRSFLLLIIMNVVFASLFVKYYSMLKGMDDYDVFMGNAVYCQEKKYLEGVIDFGFWRLIYGSSTSNFFYETTPLDLIIDLNHDTTFKVRIYDSSIFPEEMSIEYVVNVSNGMLKKKLGYGNFDYGNLTAFWGDDTPEIYLDSIINLEKFERIKKHNYQLSNQNNEKMWFNCKSLALIREKKVFSENKVIERVIEKNVMSGSKIFKKKESRSYNEMNRIMSIKSSVFTRKGIWDYLSFRFSLNDIPKFYNSEEFFEYDGNEIVDYSLSINKKNIWSFKKEPDAYEIRYYTDFDF